MYTQCPDCTSVFEISPEHLGAAGGMVRCGVCNTTFNALRRLTEKPPGAPETEAKSDDIVQKAKTDAPPPVSATPPPTQTDAFDDLLDSPTEESEEEDDAPEPREVDDEATIAADEFSQEDDDVSKIESVKDSQGTQNSTPEITDEPASDAPEAYSDEVGIDDSDFDEQEKIESVGNDDAVAEDDPADEGETETDDPLVAEFDDSIEDDDTVDVDAAEEELNELLEDLDEHDDSAIENPDDMFSTSQILEEWDIDEGEHDLEALLADETLLDEPDTEKTDATPAESTEQDDSQDSQDDDAEPEQSDVEEDVSADEQAEDEPAADDEITLNDDDTIDDDEDLVIADASNMVELNDLDEFEDLDVLIDEVPLEQDELLQDLDDHESLEGLSEGLGDEPERASDEATPHDSPDSASTSIDDTNDEPQSSEADNEYDEDSDAEDETDPEEVDSDSESLEADEYEESLDAADAYDDDLSEEEKDYLESHSVPDEEDAAEMEEELAGDAEPSDSETTEDIDTHLNEPEDTEHADEAPAAVQANSNNVLTDGVDGQFEEDYTDAQDLKDLGHYLSPKKSLGRRFAEGLFVVTLVALLAGQYVHHNRTTLATHPTFGEPIRSAYSAVGKELKADWKVADYRVARHTIVPNDDDANVLMARATVVNNSEFERPLPLIRLRLNNRWGDAIYGRVFTPQEYIGGDVPQTLAGKGKLEVILDLVHPAPDEEIGYSFDVCLDSPGGPDCGSPGVFTE